MSTSPEAKQVKRGIFIVLEGIEGSGKSTQAQRLAATLERRGVPCLLVREPGGTALGEQIRGLLLHGGTMGGLSELLLMLAARAALLEERVRPALAAGEVVIADRYSLSTLAYQGYGRQLELERVREAVRFATGGLEPDLTLLLELPREEADARRVQRSGGEDRIERAGQEFHERVAEAYRLLAESDPGIERVSGAGSEAEVHARIEGVLAGRFPETFAEGPGFTEQQSGASGGSR